MMRQLPKFTYKGLTIIMSNPSRFDIEHKKLLSGVAGHIFDKDCLQPEMNILQCDVREIEDSSPLLPDTKCILLMGEKAHRLYTKVNTTLDENRGSPVIVNNIPCISTYTAQDAMDSKNYEKDNNSQYQTIEEYLSDEIAAGEIFEAKGRGRTARSNYRWWLQQDTKKALRIIKHGGTLPSEILSEPQYILRPSSAELIVALTETKGDYFHVDIETDFETLDIRCIAFSFESKPETVYVFQVLDINYQPAYSNIHKILLAFSIALRDNTAVAHNGALFDFLVFAIKLHIPIGKCVYDTMVAQHRIYPDIEKSLGHCMSLATYQPYHKNEGVHTYRTQTQADQLMYYCGKDVYGMMLVRKWQELLYSKDEGLRASIFQANRAIKPFLTQTYLGMRYNEAKRREWVKENDRKMKQYLRIMDILHGPTVQPLISNKKCIEYFHNQLGYKIVGRSKKTGAASLDEKALLQLKLKYPENIVIDFLIKYRAVKKETGTLMFRPWIAPAIELDYIEEEEQEEQEEQVQLL